MVDSSRYGVTWASYKAVVEENEKLLAQNTILLEGIKAELKRCGGVVPILREAVKKYNELEATELRSNGGADGQDKQRL